MEGDRLYRNLKQLCAEQNMNLSQLERSLNFSAGSLSKWAQSVPSVDKVAAVADFFGISIDQLYGRTDRKKEARIVQGMTTVTTSGEMQWTPCSRRHMRELNFAPPYEAEILAEMYASSYKKLKLYFGKRLDEYGGGFELYLSFENAPFMYREEKEELLSDLWDAIKEREHSEIERLERYTEEIFGDW